MADSLFPSLTDPTLSAARPTFDKARIAEVDSRDKAMEVAKEFEAMFIQEMLAPVFNELGTDGPFGGGAAEKAFRPMLLEQYARNISEAGGVGVAESVLGEILRMQGLE